MSTDTPTDDTENRTENTTENQDRSAPPIDEQRRIFHECVHDIPHSVPDWGRRVIYAWCNRMGTEPPFAVNQGDGGTTTWCNDCSSGIDPVPAAFHWEGWGSLCGHCSVYRIGKKGDNPRIDERDDKLYESRKRAEGWD